MNTTSATEPAASAPGAPAPPPVTYADEARVLAFIAAHNLGDWVEQAVRFAWDAFPGAKGMTLEMFGAPGECGEHPFLDVATGTGVGESLRQDRDFVERWIAATPPRVTDLMGVSIDLR